MQNLNSKIPMKDRDPAGRVNNDLHRVRKYRFKKTVTKPLTLESARTLGNLEMNSENIYFEIISSSEADIMNEDPTATIHVDATYKVVKPKDEKMDYRSAIQLVTISRFSRYLSRYVLLEFFFCLILLIFFPIYL